MLKPNHPKSISRVNLPINNIINLQAFQDAFKEAYDKEILFLHCWGLAGSGKSQIIQSLVKEFPFDAKLKGNFIKWHIRCKDLGHLIKTELQKLAGELVTKGHIKEKLYISILKEISASKTKLLLDTLLNCKFSTVIIFEDPLTTDCEEMIQEVFQCLQQSDIIEKAKETRIHVYLTSRKEEVILPSKEQNNISIRTKTSKKNSYIQKNVKGFSETESICYLLESFGRSDQDKENAKKVFQRFGGLPLGLQVAKSFCLNACTYEYYLSYLNNLEQQLEDTIEVDEKGAIIVEREEKNVFQAIAISFAYSENSDETSAPLSWKILSCLSYFHYECIPRFVIEYCCDVVRDTAVNSWTMNSKQFVGCLIDKLLKFGLCVQPVISEGHFVKEISFHEVVTSSFQLQLFRFSNFCPLSKPIEVMSGLTTKDFRYYPQFQQMFNIRRHAQNLLNYAGRDKGVCTCENNHLKRALLSHLYDATAAIMLYECFELFVVTCQNYFEKAMALLCDDQDLQWKNVIQDIENEKDLKQVAKDIFNWSKQKSKSLPKHFVLEYSSKLNHCLTDKTKQFLLSKCPKTASGKVEEILNQNGSRRELIDRLIDCKLFLPESKYREIFYAERVASILCNWSRASLLTDTCFRRQERMLDLVKYISEECRESCKICLFIEQFSYQTGTMSILLKKRENCKNYKVISLGEKMLQNSNDKSHIYENGMLKEMFGPSRVATRIYFLRYVVKAYTRLIINEQESKKVANNRCKDLLKLAIENVAEVSNATECIIQCAKYYASKKDFCKSLSCFKEFFNIDQTRVNIRFSVQCWSVYNYAYLVSCYSSADRCKNAIKRCELVLHANEKIGKDLENRLKNYLKKLIKISEEYCMICSSKLLHCHA